MAKSQKETLHVTALEEAPKPAAVILCAECRFWVRSAPSSFGRCHRWSDFLIENRDGISSAPLIPMTTDKTTCSEAKIIS